MKTHPTVTRDEFRDVWDNLDKTTKDVSWLLSLNVLMVIDSCTNNGRRT